MTQDYDRVRLSDCGPRDGLAAISRPISTSDKVDLIESIANAGVTRIECVAFHHPRVNPRNADAEVVMGQITKSNGVKYLGLVPDEIGCRRALTTVVDEVVTLVSASDAFNRAQLGETFKETLNKTLPSIFSSAHQAGKIITVYIQTAFGCPFTGSVQPNTVISLASRLVYLGANRLSITDSTGMANPRQVRELMSQIMGLGLECEIGVHFHNARGTGLANCLAAYEAGVRHFDTAIGGLSRQLVGSPMREIGKGNVPTEDLVNVLEEMGVSTGIDMESLLLAVEKAEKLAGHPLAGHILRAGTSEKLQKQPATVDFSQ